MQKTLLMLAAMLGLTGTATYADELAMPTTAAEAKAAQPEPEPAAVPAPVTLPHKGISMTEVVHEFGEPRVKHPAVGGSGPRQPPITRWDYENFSVFFENTHVIDAVIPDHPAELHNTQELKATP